MPRSPYHVIGPDQVLVYGARKALLIDFSQATARQVDEADASALWQGSDGERPQRVLEAGNRTGFFSDGFCDHPQAGRRGTAGPLDFLWIELTARCNLKCLHCYADSAAHRQVDLPNETVKAVIDQAVELGCRTLQFTGGECLLRKDIPDLVNHAAEKGALFIEVFTNGTLLTEPLVKFFSQKGIHVALSLYSYRQEVHDRVTGVPGSYQKTIEALKLLLAYDVPTRCSTVALKQNEPDLDGTTYFLSQLGVQCNVPDPVRPSGRGMVHENWPENYGRRFKLTQPCFMVSAAAFEWNRTRNSCWYGKAAVTSDGSVIPCVFARQQTTGRLPAQSLGEIIHGERMQAYWCLTYDQVEDCKACEYRYLCTDCRPLALGLTGSLYAKSPRCTYDPYKGVWGEK
jgi:radical SAM protein with 4Fe4S-binding SPASM domain